MTERKGILKCYKACETLWKNPVCSMVSLASCFGLGLPSVCKHSSRDSSEKDIHISHAGTSLHSSNLNSAFLLSGFLITERSPSLLYIVVFADEH